MQGNDFRRMPGMIFSRLFPQYAAHRRGAHFFDISGVILLIFPCFAADFVTAL